MFILRHGETLWNVQGRMQGGLDSPLTERGRAQAAQQGEILRRAGATGLPVYSSPQGRARETARLVMPGAEPIRDARIAEIGMGDWQGLSFEEIRRASPDATANPGSFLWKFSAPGGERMEDMLRRLENFRTAVPAEAVVVTHGVSAQLLRGLMLGLDVEGMDALDDRQGVVWHCTSQGEDLLTP
ncbi:histidine phosphatase family protein [Tropicimonas sp. TH_r6]|uniref:histidine phosphatase family protein n=1 Tax=Tropicimonas sp. TH_r6 TaxID=3082085 RepID=UPI002953C6B5|nr:histidine phosphatase family protein [Tropicimonas sp. TH_r6]MDV7145753.1 histidine phosphatase family protein [Tropicimonas sp. TH_r6]